MTKDELIAYAAQRYGAAPEYLWARSPSAFVLRHRAGGKWFAVVLEVRRDKLGLRGEDTVFLLNTKCGPIFSGSFRDQDGIVPAWHMNKEQWIGALLDGSASDRTIEELLEISYGLTRGKNDP